MSTKRGEPQNSAPPQPQQGTQQAPQKSPQQGNQGQQPQQGNQNQQPSQAPTQTQQSTQDNQQNQDDQQIQQQCESAAQFEGVPVDKLRTVMVSAIAAHGSLRSGPGRDMTGSPACNCANEQSGPQKQQKGNDDWQCTAAGLQGVTTPASAIEGNAAPIAASRIISDPGFGSSSKNMLERSIGGNAGRSDGWLAVGVLRANGWNKAADVTTHYLANDDGGYPDNSIAKDLQLATSQVDDLGRDPYTGLYNDPNVSSLPDLLKLARQAALSDAQKCGKATSAGSSFTEVFGQGWSEVAGSEPDSVYSLGRYQAEIVTQVESQGGNNVIRQRFYIYDYTDYAHNSDTITHHFPTSFQDGKDALKSTIIDELSTLRDIGYARNFNTLGTSTIQTFQSP